MSIIYSILATLISLNLIIGMPAGLATSYTSMGFILTLLFIVIKTKQELKFSISDYKIEILFAVWAIISCFKVTASPEIFAILKSFGLIFLALLIRKNINLLNIPYSYIFKSLLVGVTLSIIIFYIEYFTNGAMSRAFRSIFAEGSNKSFALHNLDRGCTLLAIASWLLFRIFIDKKFYTLTATYYFLILLLLYYSDSFASLIAYLLAGIIVAICYLHPVCLTYCKKLVIIGSFLFPVIAYIIQPYTLSEKYDQVLPISSKHRLFIWNYVAHKIPQQLVTGIGFNSSKHFDINKNEEINFKGHILSPLPLHPHNNILQIFFELGLVGLVLGMILVNKYIKNITDLLTFGCFINYYIVGMISYNTWQSWWFLAAIWCYLMNKIIDKMIIRVVREQK